MEKLLYDIIQRRCALGQNEIFAYADDLALICYNRRTPEEVIDEILEWADANGMSVNKRKSGILQILAKKQQLSNLKEDIKGIPVVKSYKYLGLHINTYIKVQGHIDKVMPKINYLTYRLKWIPQCETSLRLRVNLWHLFIRSLIELALMYDVVTTTKKNTRISLDGAERHSRNSME